MTAIGVCDEHRLLGYAERVHGGLVATVRYVDGHASGVVYSGGRLPEVQMPDPTTIIHIDPEILGGTPVFVGTRVPFQNLIDYLAGGESLDEFIRQFPSVKREQAQASLALAREALEALVAA